MPKKSFNAILLFLDELYFNFQEVSQTRLVNVPKLIKVVDHPVEHRKLNFDTTMHVQLDFFFFQTNTCKFFHN